MAANKQIFIPAINIKGSFMEEIGGAEDKIAYPGESFDISLSLEDFQNPEEYHTTWNNKPRAVKTKLLRNAAK
jgi:hypothetical protein